MRALRALALCSASCLFGQSAGILAGGTEPKQKAADYPAHVTLDNTSIGAEYLVHSFSGHNQTFITADYLVIEVAVFPGRNEPVEIGTQTFALRLNGRKQAISPDAPGFVAASLKYPD